MTPRRKQRLILAGLLFAGCALAVGLTLLALKQNINLFFSPTDVIAGRAPERGNFRIGGMVVADSVQRGDDLLVQFTVTDTNENVRVHYRGILPDLFREGQGVVARGTLQGQVFIADQVLAKHDETYMPPEVAAALRQAEALRREKSSATK